MDTAKRIGGVVLMILLAYFVLLPMFWGAMPPTASVAFPEDWPHDQDMPLQVQVSSMHPNYSLTTVRFYVDNPNSTMEGIGKPFYALALIQQPSKAFSLMNPLRRMTYATGEIVEVTIPFARLAREQITGPGLLSGSLDIQIDHPGGRNRYNSIANQAQARQESIRLPFTIQLQ